MCAACRAAEAGSRARSSDPIAEKEALLAAVLQSARTTDPVDDEDVAAADAGGPRGTAGDTGEHSAIRGTSAVDVVEPEPEHVALREIAPGDEDDQVAPVPEAEVESDADVGPTDPQEDQAVAASLVEELDESQHAVHRLEGRSSSESEERVTNGGKASAQIGQDTAEDLAALFNAPTPWDRDPTPPDTPPEPDIEPAAPRPAYDTAEDLAALFNAPTSWDRDPTPPDTPPEPDIEPAAPRPAYDTAEDLAALFNAPTPWDRDPALSGTADDAQMASALSFDELEQEDDDPATDRPTSGRLPESVFDPASSWDTDSGSGSYSADEWPWIGKSGDGGFWAPPTDRSGTAAADGYSSTRSSAFGDHLTDESIYGTGEQPVTTGEQPAAPSAETQQQAEQGAGARLKAAFRDLGAWTAVAQVALLAVGMLCIIQVFVLIVVTSYLNDASDAGGDVAVGSLSAHAKVDGVMLPALLMFAVVAFAFAAWRGIVTRARDASVTERRIYIIGLPLVLWPVAFAAVMLLLVIIPGAPPTVSAAQRITQWAIFACAVLGVACFAAPRGLEATPASQNEDVRTRRGGAAGGGVAPTGSTSAA